LLWNQEMKLNSQRARRSKSKTNVGKLDLEHIAFEEHIKDSFTLVGCFTEYTLERDKQGHYKNMSVILEWPIWHRAWHAALKSYGIEN
jgi:hypothetical protein